MVELCYRDDESTAGDRMNEWASCQLCFITFVFLSVEIPSISSRPYYYPHNAEARNRKRFISINVQLH